jgi:hypothetical protein
MTGALTDLRTRLTTANFATPIALGRVPDTPDAVLALLEYPGERSRDFDASMRPVLERIAVRMIARASKAAGVAAAESIAWLAYRALRGKHVTIGARRYDWIAPLAVPAPLGFDDNDRPLYIVKWGLQRHGDLT